MEKVKTHHDLKSFLEIVVEELKTIGNYTEVRIIVPSDRFGFYLQILRKDKGFASFYFEESRIFNKSPSSYAKIFHDFCEQIETGRPIFDTYPSDYIPPIVHFPAPIH